MLIVRKFLAIFLVILCFYFPADVFASNGLFSQGVPAASLAMGGTGAVEPQDASVALINPAIVAKVEPRIDVAFDLAFLDVALDTGSVAGIGNSYGYQKSRSDIVLLPQGAFCGQFGESSWYYGFSAGVVSGYELDYPHSRLTESITGNNFDNHAETVTFEFVPSFACKLSEKWALGFAPVLTFNRLEANFVNDAYVETQGADNGSHSWGGGFNIGTIYDFNEYWSFALSYKSKRWNQKLNEYKDIFKRFNSPPQYIAGVAFKPAKKILFETDLKFIHWKDCRMFSKPSRSRGLGWDNQLVIAFGAQYDIFERMRLRAGYNYGKSPISEDNVYSNSMFPLITEHHMSFGVGYDLSSHVVLDLGWVHTFENAMSEAGTGDAKSQAGKNARIWTGADSVQLGISYVF